MPDLDNITDVLNLLKKAQDADVDRREKLREVDYFLNKPDGQWEPEIISRFKTLNRPRYTFDRCNPIVNQIWGEMAANDIGSKVKPAGGDATKELAKTYDGLIRNIENISDAKNIYAQAGKKMIATGFAAWRVTHDWADADAFDQDLFLLPISNAVDRVWFDPGAELQTMQDAKYVFVLQALTKDEYDKRFPEGSGTSVGQDRLSDAYTHKPEQIIVGEFIWKEPVKKMLFMLDDEAGTVLEEEQFFKIEDELRERNINIARQRERDTFEIKTRFFDGEDWLSEAKETVFDLLPIIPIYANFGISENKVIYWGAVEKLLDAQRVFNYAGSKEIEEVALSPRAKLMMTPAQAKGHTATLDAMNNSPDPVQLYNPDTQAPPPYQTAGPQVNPGLSSVMANAANNIEASAGLFGANLAKNPALQSGIAIELQQNKGDIGTYEYFKALEIGVNQTAKVLVRAIPKVYDSERQVRVIGEDGSFEIVTLNERIFDDESGQWVELNNLSQGIYDVTTDMGPAFQNRQEETRQALLQLANVVPGIIEENQDILLNNTPLPGMDQATERARRRLLQQGIIPESQWTDEEIQEIQAAQEAAANQPPPPPSPVEQAVIEQTQAQTADVLSKAQERQDRAQLELLKIQQKQEQMEFDQSQKLAEFQQSVQQQLLEAQQQAAELQKQTIEELKTMADTFKTIREGMGVDTFIGPNIIEAGIQQAQILNEAQDDLQTATER